MQHLSKVRLRLTRRLPRRFVVADRSMEPALHSGQGLIAIRSTRARIGQLRCVEYPNQQEFWLVKRVAEVDGDVMTVESDNRSVDTIDSATFGPVPIDGSYRVVIKIPRRLM